MKMGKELMRRVLCIVLVCAIILTLTPESYSRLINAGESITVGFIAEGADTPQAPEQISVTGQRETEQDMSGDMADFGGCCRVSTEISNVWNGAMIGKIILKNIGNETIKGWNLHFAWQGKITSMWNASYEGDETGHTIRPMDYNNEIKPGDQV